MLRPSLRTSMTPDRKSCIAPMKMPPSVIHRKATGPNAAPKIAPKIGPVPAMLSNWIRKTRQRGMGT